MILPYLKSMLPYCCAALPAALLWRALAVRRLRRRGLQTSALHELPRIEFGPAGLVFDMGDPAQNRINLIPLRILYDTYVEVTEFHNYSYLVVSFFGNVGIFMPLGLLAPLLWARADGWRQCAAAGFCVSLFIELCQLPLNRCSDIDDLILNTLGALAGYGLFVLLRRYAPRFVLRCRVRPASGMEDAAPGLPADAGK